MSNSLRTATVRTKRSRVWQNNRAELYIFFHLCIVLSVRWLIRLFTLLCCAMACRCNIECPVAFNVNYDYYLFQFRAIVNLCAFFLGFASADGNGISKEKINPFTVEWHRCKRARGANFNNYHVIGERNAPNKQPTVRPPAFVCFGCEEAGNCTRRLSHKFSCHLQWCNSERKFVCVATAAAACQCSANTHAERTEMKQTHPTFMWRNSKACLIRSFNQIGNRWFSFNPTTGSKLVLFIFR